MQEILDLLGPVLLAYGGDLGIVVQIVSIIGSLRLINKPLFSFLRSVSAFTYWTDQDDLFLDRVEESKWYKGFIYLLDWVASAKLTKKDKK